MSDLYSVLADNLHLHKAPIAGEVIAVLPRAQVVENLKDSTVTGWLNVSTTLNLEEVSGYVAEIYLTPTDDAPPPDPIGDATLEVTVEKLKRLTPTGKS